MINRTTALVLTASALLAVAPAVVAQGLNPPPAPHPPLPGDPDAKRDIVERGVVGASSYEISTYGSAEGPCIEVRSGSSGGGACGDPSPLGGAIDGGVTLLGEVAVVTAAVGPDVKAMTAQDVGRIGSPVHGSIISRNGVSWGYVALKTSPLSYPPGEQRFAMPTFVVEASDAAGAVLSREDVGGSEPK